MARKVLYPGLDSSKQQIQAEEQNRTNFFILPEEYSTPVFTSTYDDTLKEIRPPESWENLYDQEGLTWHDGSKFTAESMVNKLNRALSINNEGNTLTSFKKETKFYNRFKVADLNDTFQKGFPHVFFVRPDLNIMNSDRTALLDHVAANANFSYAWNSAPELLYQLVDNAPGTDHDWMMYLSNKAESFSLSDEYIGTGEYGKTYTGYKIAYGKHNIESKTAGDFSISYSDDRNLHIYHIHKLWVEYISNLYRGSFSPKQSNVLEKIRDYTSSVYYIVTAEDGETIIFWSKYYGVFPSTSPSAHLSWASGSMIQKQSFEVKYNFSFKEDFNPLALLELNYNTGMGIKVPYIPVYDPFLGHSGDTWVGAPFVEVIDSRQDGDDKDLPYQFKLRFKNAGDTTMSSPDTHPVYNVSVQGNGYDGRVPGPKYEGFSTPSQKITWTS